MKEKRAQEMTARENSTFYNIKKNMIITRKPTQIEKRTQEGK